MEICFVLVRPVLPENIGAAARAIATMGFEELRLVNPCDHLQDRARWLACHTEVILRKALVFETLEQALSGVDFAVGATARVRKGRHEHYSPAALRKILAGKRGSIARAALVFGPESAGLTNEDLAWCDVFSTIESAQEYPVLNLAQAVMVYAYEMSLLLHNSTGTEPGSAAGLNSTRFAAFKERLSQLLCALDITPELPVHRRIIERAAALPEEDLRLAHFLREQVAAKVQKEK